ncbi:MAG: hypothetical protein IKV70_03165 [Phascolarctobacterium sp.]|nr:hypothetical protein [Phascolarctobacterium sp.]
MLLKGYTWNKVAKLAVLLLYRQKKKREEREKENYIKEKGKGEQKRRVII